MGFKMPTTMSGRRRMTWQDVVDRGFLAMITIIASFVGYQLKTMNERIQTISDKIARTEALQRANEAEDARLETEVSEVRAAVGQISREHQDMYNRLLRQ